MASTTRALRYVYPLYFHETGTHHRNSRIQKVKLIRSGSMSDHLMAPSRKSPTSMLTL